MLDNGVARDNRPHSRKSQCTEFPGSQRNIPQTGRNKGMTSSVLRGGGGV